MFPTFSTLFPLPLASLPLLPRPGPCLPQPLTTTPRYSCIASPANSHNMLKVPCAHYYSFIALPSHAAAMLTPPDPRPTCMRDMGLRALRHTASCSTYSLDIITASACLNVKANCHSRCNLNRKNMFSNQSCRVRVRKARSQATIILVLFVRGTVTPMLGGKQYQMALPLRA
ncbi:hypothetical protein E2C01_016812 [Portunus trituberculatus]|uniref:Uncharacterized protein n=1 Tax=Portunus trituberculatus TaxID=210409 RepID=A0A5B7DQ20_PORTR|nr:hypothetical protein [Portunus trituberculatus]